MNTDLMFSSNTDQWATPINFFEELNREFCFDLDPCADEYNHKCDKWFSAAQDGLSQNWGGTESFAIHHMGVIYGSGSKRHMRRGTKITPWWSC